MANQIHRVGGFTAFNTGRIENCFSAITLRAGDLTGGFCGENRGTLVNCLSRGRVRRHGGNPLSGFCARSSGSIDGCFWVSGTHGKQGADHWTDWDLAIPVQELPSQADRLRDTWDMEALWSLSQNGASDTELRLRDRPAPMVPRGQAVEINSRDAFFRTVDAINSGNFSEDTVYRLTADLDLGGKYITPISPDPHSPFPGCFDGGGHTIENFRIKAKDNTYAGLFGCIGKQGELHNLTVDCMLEGRGDHSAGLCALNHGLISNCVVRVSAVESRYSGGLAAENAGIIRQCSVRGRISTPLLFPWWSSAALLALLLCIPTGVFLTTSTPPSDQEVFAPVIMDPNAKPIEQDDSDSSAPAPDNLTDSGASFIMNADMAVSRENYAGFIGLRCPPWSRRGFVATATVSDSDLMKNGAAYQKSAVVYQSGLIAPNMAVDVVTLSRLPDGSTLPSGTYELMVQFDFYDVETNERTPVSSTAPIIVTIS